MRHDVSALRVEWLTSFVAVARNGSFSAAARSLYRSQSRVSTHVAQLEQHLGSRLVDRSSLPVRLTAEGTLLLPHVEEALDRLDLLSGVAADAAGAVRGEVRLGVYPSVAVWLFPQVAVALRDQHPDVSLQLHEGPTVALEAALTGGDVDLAVRPVVPLVADDRLRHRVLWSEPLVAVLPTGHRLARRQEVRLGEIAGDPLVCIGDRGRRLTRQYEANLALAAVGVSPRIVHRTDQPQTLVALVRAGLGTGLTNALAMTTACTDGVRLLPVTDAPRQRQVALFWRDEQPGTGATRLVADTVRAVPAPVWPWDPPAAAGPAAPPAPSGEGP